MLPCRLHPTTSPFFLKRKNNRNTRILYVDIHAYKMNVFFFFLLKLFWLLSMLLFYFGPLLPSTWWPFSIISNIFMLLMYIAVKSDDHFEGISFKVCTLFSDTSLVLVVCANFKNYFSSKYIRAWYRFSFLVFFFFFSNCLRRLASPLCLLIL